MKIQLLLFCLIAPFCIYGESCTDATLSGNGKDTYTSSNDAVASGKTCKKIVYNDGSSSTDGYQYYYSPCSYTDFCGTKVDPSASDVKEEYVCQSKFENGHHCSSNEECRSGYCSDSHCVSKLHYREEGEYCEHSDYCKPNLKCTSDTCLPMPGEGEHCDSACKSGYYCHNIDDICVEMMSVDDDTVLYSGTVGDEKDAQNYAMRPLCKSWTLAQVISPDSSYEFKCLPAIAIEGADATTGLLECSDDSDCVYNVAGSTTIVSSSSSTSLEQILANGVQLHFERFPGSSFGCMPCSISGIRYVPDMKRYCYPGGGEAAFFAKNNENFKTYITSDLQCVDYPSGNYYCNEEGSNEGDYYYALLNPSQYIIRELSTVGSLIYSNSEIVKISAEASFISISSAVLVAILLLL